MLKLNIRNWQEQMKKAGINAEQKNKQIHRLAGQLLKKKVVDYTPKGDPSLWKWPAKKGYTPGFLKSNWVLIWNGNRMTISNDAPYAIRVEYGWSSQAPDGMLRRAKAEFPALLKQASDIVR